MSVRRILLLSLLIVQAERSPAETLRPAPDTSEWDNACADAAAVLMSNVAEKKLPLWVSKCNANPDRRICRETRSMVEQVRQKAFADLTCDK